MRRYRYGFNGKEKDESGEWGDLTHYDYGFRIYNPGIGRFMSVDPLTYSYPFYTPFQFAGNKPIIAIDLDGLEEEFKFNAYAGMEAASKPGLSQSESREVYQQTVESYKVFASAPSEIIAKGVGIGVAIGVAATAVTYFGVESIAGFVVNEVKDEALSLATNGISDFADLSKLSTKAFKKIVESSRKLKGSDPRGLQSLKKKVDRQDDAFKDVSKSQEKAEGIIKDVLNKESNPNAIIKPTIERRGVKQKDIFNPDSGQGVRINVEDNSFDTFINVAKKKE